MKKNLGTGILLALLILFVGVSGAAASEQETAVSSEAAEWTVLIYIAGADLESDYGYATENLWEICQIQYPEYILPIFQINSQAELEEVVRRNQERGKVNVLIETGGSLRWHSERLDQEIKMESIQRWRFDCFSVLDQDLKGAKNGLTLLETKPLASMANPETLMDFIRWGVSTCPAKKTALVLWGHGDGARSGVLNDEIFSNDILKLYELKECLKEAETTFEAIVIDACLMGSIETAWAVMDNARWMIASEETVPGRGTAVDDWLRELYANPAMDGGQLGRVICDTTVKKYENQTDEKAKAILTWSVVDLSKMDHLLELCSRFFHEMVDIYLKYPNLSLPYAKYVLEAEEFGDGTHDMRDLSSVFNNKDGIYLMDLDLRNEMLNTLSEAITYNVRGSARSGALGLSFCYPVNFTNEEMDVFSQNTPFVEYLAFMDAFKEWDAPDWVYEQTERLPPVDTVEALQVKMTGVRDDQNAPLLRIENGLLNISGVYYLLYRYHEETEQTVCLGRTVCVTRGGDAKADLWGANEPWLWPSVNGVPCYMGLVMEKNRQERQDYLYNIPVQIGMDICTLRCGRVDAMNLENEMARTYTVYGLWKGFDEHSEVMSRSVKSLSMLAGQDYRLLYPTENSGSHGQRMYETSETKTMYRNLQVDEAPLPPGTYYIEFEVDDLFKRPFFMDRIEMHWDGEKATFPNLDAWAGTGE